MGNEMICSEIKDISLSYGAWVPILILKGYTDF